MYKVLIIGCGTIAGYFSDAEIDRAQSRHAWAFKSHEGFDVAGCVDADRERAEHFADVTAPLLFLQGTKDKLADIDAVQSVCKDLGNQATLHIVDTADHGFKVLKRSGKTHEEVVVELAGKIAAWTAGIAGV